MFLPFLIFMTLCYSGCETISALQLLTFLFDLFSYSVLIVSVAGGDANRLLSTLERRAAISWRHLHDRKIRRIASA